MWEPAAGNHAIERAALTLVTDDLPSKLFDKVLAMTTGQAKAEGLTIDLPLQTMTFNVNMGQPKAAVAPQAIQTGKLFRSNPQGGLADFEAICSINNYSLISTKYSTWSDFISKFERLLSKSIESALKAVDLKEVRLEYWDRFERKCNNPGAGDPLLKEQSALIPAFYGTRQDSWHNHVGFFSDRIHGFRTLANINVDVIANPPGAPRLFQSGTEAQARVYTATTIRTEGATTIDSWSDLASVVDSQHEMSKAMLGETIHPDLATAIKLNAQPF